MRLAKGTIIANDQEYRDDFAFRRSRSPVELATGYTTRARRRPREGPEAWFELLNIRRRMTLYRRRRRAIAARRIWGAPRRLVRLEADDRAVSPPRGVGRDDAIVVRRVSDQAPHRLRPGTGRDARTLDRRPRVDIRRYDRCKRRASAVLEEQGVRLSVLRDGAIQRRTVERDSCRRERDNRGFCNDGEIDRDGAGAVARDGRRNIDRRGISAWSQHTDCRLKIQIRRRRRRAQRHRQPIRWLSRRICGWTYCQSRKRS